jgi:ligand-binding SRPBCC domain-containing protein
VIERTSRLAAPPATVWARVSTMAGVNAELRPLVRMTAPPGARIERGFTSTILLLGVLPFDRHHVHLDRFDPPHGFAERSRTLVHREWRHERTLRDDGAGGTLLTDRVAYAARVPVPRAAIALVFAWRHRQLRRAFGTG